MKKTWPFAFFFLDFAGFAAFSPFMVLYFQSLNFTGTQIGILAGIAPLIILIAAPLWTNTADRTNKHRLILSFSMLGSVIAVALYPFMHSFGTVLALLIVANLFAAPVYALGSSAAMHMLGEDKHHFGRISAGGTIGFGTSALISGILVERFGLNVAFWLGAAFFFSAFLVGLRLVFGPTDGQSLMNAANVSALLSRREWVLFLMLAFSGGIAFAVGVSYFYPYMSELGMRESAMGLALTLGTIAEVPVLLSASWFMRRFNAYGTLILAVAFTGLRLALFGLVDRPPIVMAIQILNGLSIPLLLVAGVTYADQLAPSNLRASGQGLFSAAFYGLGNAAGGFLGGLLIAATSGQTLFLASGLAVLLILAAVTLLRGRAPAPAQTGL